MWKVVTQVNQINNQNKNTMNFIDKLASYSTAKWNVKDQELLKSFDPEGFKKIESAEVVEKEQDWGTSISVCLHMKSGDMKYVNLSRDSDLEDGDEVDLNSLEILTLEREGYDDIYRADGKVKRGRK